jgi:hypothetical protein
VELGGFFPADKYRKVLYEKPGNANHCVTLVLDGRRSNRSGIGARIRVDVVERGKPRSIHVLAGTGGSFGSSSLQQEIGLGAAERIDVIEVSWPTSGLRQRFTAVAMDRVYEVKEGADRLAEIPRKRFALGG